MNGGIVYIGKVRDFRAAALPEMRRAAMAGAVLSLDAARLQRRLDGLMKDERRREQCSSGTDDDYPALKAAWIGKRTMATVAARRQMAGAYRLLLRRCVFRGGCGSAASHA